MRNNSIYENLFTRLFPSIKELFYNYSAKFTVTNHQGITNSLLRETITID